MITIALLITVLQSNPVGGFLLFLILLALAQIQRWQK